MNHFSQTAYFFAFWRFLAEGQWRKRIGSAGVSKLQLGQTRSAMGWTLPQSFAGLACCGPDAPDSGADQKRQAADRRVGGKSHPGRNGERDGRTDHHHPDRRGQKNQSCKHLTQPPREVFDKNARHAWQDYDRLLVKVRRKGLVLMRSLLACMQESRSKSALGCKKSRAHPGVDSPYRGVGRSCKIRKTRNNFLSGERQGNRIALPFAKREGVQCRIAAKWQNSVRPNCWKDRELHEECLSFVIPHQHGRPVAGQEDLR